jgi:hypothetical protein
MTLWPHQVHLINLGSFRKMIGDPGAIRTRGPQIRNLMLYPAELRGPAAFNSSEVLPIN